MMTQVVDALDRYLAEFERAVVRGNGAPAWLAHKRRTAMERFQALGFPTTAEEEWRFTSVAPIAETAFELDADGQAGGQLDALAPFRLTGIASAEIVLVNGRYASQLSTVSALPAGVRVESLASVLARDPARVEPHLASAARFDRRPFTALNTAFLADGVFVSVSP